MGEGSSLFYDGRKLPERDRVVREVGAGTATVPDELTDEYAERIDTLFENLSKTINAANAIIPEFEEMARALFIPVPPEAAEIRSAVARKDQSVPDGSRINFDLFRDALENYDRLRVNMSVQTASVLDGNPPLDAVRIERVRHKLENGDLDATELAIFASIFLTRFILSKLQEQFTLQTVNSMIAGKVPTGSEASTSLSAIIASIFLSILVDIANESALAALSQPRFSDPGGGVTSVTNEQVSQAKSNPPDLGRLEQLAIRKIGEADYQIILDYVMGFIGTSDDPKYHAWLAYMDAKEIRNRAIQHYRFGPQYSSKELRLFNNIPDPQPETVVVDTVVTVQAADRNLTPGLLGTISMNSEHLCVMEEEATSLQGNLYLIAQMMSSRFAADVICCLTRFFGNFDDKTIKIMKIILVFARGLLSQRIVVDLQATLSNLLNWLTNGIRDFLIAFMDRIIDMVVDPLLDLLDQLEAEWNLLVNGCPLLQITIDFVLKIILQLKVQLRKLINGISFGSIQFGDNIQERYTDLYETRTIKVILDLIDRLLSAIVENQCELNSDGRIVLPELVKVSDSAATAQEDYTISLSEEVIAEHFPESQPFTIDEDDTRPAYSIPALGDAAEAGDERLILREILDQCGHAFSDEDLDRIFRATDGNT